MLSDPLFKYLFFLTLLCVASVAAVLWAIKTFNRNDSVIEDPIVQNLERLYNAPAFVKDGSARPNEGRRP